MDRANSADGNHKFDNWARPSFSDANSSRHALASPNGDLTRVDLTRTEPHDLLFCAREGQTCNTDGRRLDIWYGAENGAWRYMQTGAVQCNNATFGGDPAPNRNKMCLARVSDQNQNLRLCAQEGQYCGFVGYRTVHYGVPGRFTTKQLHYGTSCNNATFGDPAPNTPKACYLVE